jgi:hypothetical protein
MFMSAVAVAQEPEVASTRQAGDQNDVSVELASGIEYEVGDYGTGTQISSLSVPASLRVMTGHLQLVAILPYRRVEAPANVVPGGLLGLPIIGPTTPGDERTAREGLGDLTLGAMYGVPTDVVDVTLSGSVKVPTADEGLGTGKTDYTVGAEISKTLGSGIIPFAGVSYTMPGDPEGFTARWVRFHGRVRRRNRLACAGLCLVPLRREPQSADRKRPAAERGSEHGHW